MENTIQGLGFDVSSLPPKAYEATILIPGPWGPRIIFILGLYWDNGKENGNYRNYRGYIGITSQVKRLGVEGFGFKLHDLHCRA